VVIEDLAVRNMTACPKPKADPENPGHHLENGHAAKAGLNRSLLDTAPGEFRRQLTYKMGWHGGHLLVADRFFPSCCRRDCLTTPWPHWVRTVRQL
jgi:putative transposase